MHPSPLTFTVRLPPELWFLILRYATYAPFPSTTPSSELSLSSNHHHHHHHHHHHQNSITLPFHVRLSNYTSDLKWKASLTRVCKDWNLWGQEFLWEHLWIASAKDAKLLLGLVCGQPAPQAEQEQPMRAGHTTMDAHKWSTVKALGKEKLKNAGFRLKHLCHKSDPKPSLSLPLHNNTTLSPSRRKNIASYIKKLHIETPSMDRCCPFDLMSILQKCERLQVFTDLRGVRSGFGFVGVGDTGLDWTSRNPPSVPSIKESMLGYSEPVVAESLSTPERHLFPPSRIQKTYHHHPTSDPILQALLQQKSTLKRITFTNYKYDPDDPEGGVRFWEDVGGALTSDGSTGMHLAATIESLQVVMSTRGVGMGFNDYPRRNTFSHPLTRRLEAGLLTSLGIDINPSLLPSNRHQPLTLPSLHSLRIPLTSPTLLVISTWSLPALQSLSVVSIDFTGWRRLGFKQFMDVHGGGLIRFEIVGGGESGEEEGWITEREDGLYGTNPHHPISNLLRQQQQQQSLHLPLTCPHLKHFICSSNASEWNWETPDWIAPHVLMPEHFGVEEIGVWGLEGKVVGGGGAEYDGVSFRRRSSRTMLSTWTTTWGSDDFSSSTTSSEDEEHQQHLLEEQPFFMLQEQFGSLLRKEAFPSLVCIRDMSWESDLIRRSVGIGCGLATCSSDSEPTMKKKKKEKTLASRLTSFTTRSSTFTSTQASSSSSSPPLPPPPPTTTSDDITSSPTDQQQSYKIRKFWLGVLEMCDRRGVYLEDWMGRRVVVAV